MKTPWPTSLLKEDTRLRWNHHVLSQVPHSFAFKDRTLKDHILWVITDGVVRVETSDQVFEGKPGSVIWIPPLTSHSALIPKGAKPMTCYSFRFQVEHDGKPLAFKKPLLQQHPLGLHLADQLYGDCCHGEKEGEWRIPCHLLLLYTDLKRGATPSQGGLTHRQRAKLEHFVDENLGLQPTVRQLAQGLGLTQDYFSRQFKKSYGRSPRRWLIEKRLQKAAFLLQHGRKDIAGLARELGYEDPNFFSRQFSKEFGLPPSSYPR